MRNKAMIIGVSALTLGLSNMIPVYAIDKASKKEEVVYAMLNSDGSVDGGYVVNVMYSEDGQIIDYGNYSEVKNLTTTDELTYKDGKIVASTSSDKLYYEGYLKEIELPWNIDIQYYLDNNSISAKDLAGASGHLKIVMNITKNIDANETFFDNFALQASMTLNTNLCSNIVAQGATIANVGEDKQLTYTILPGSEKEIAVESDVTDFEMDAIAINGVQLDLGIDIDNMDTSELNDKIDEIVDAVSDLNDGAEELDDGANALVEGSTALNEGTSTVNSGASSLSQGANELVSGIEQIQTGLTTLNGQSESLTSGSSEVKEALFTINSSLENVNINSDDLSTLIEASTQIQSGIDNLVTYLETIDSTISSYESQVGSLSDIQSSTTETISQLEYLASIDIENAGLYQQLIQLLQAGYASEQILQGLQSNNSTALSGAQQLQSSYKEFNNSITELVNSLSALIENMSQLKVGIQQLVDNYDTLDNGINDYTEAVAQIVAGYNQIYSASQTLASGANDLYSGTQSLVNGSENLLDGSETLAEGTAELYEGTSTFYEEVNDIDITDSIQDVIDDLMGSDYEPVSFVDEQNTDVKMVQFVIKTNAIEKEEENEMEEIVEEKSIWQKILSFFGLDN
ncbi:MAG: hypothetical protein LUG12_09435 [Erysipelotrichaceae bacterium]|nr:hypothetical protein [Erysipelotrichaceae bacterium]